MLRDFTAGVEQGEKVVISGKSGVGKSSLFRMLLGFIRPETGEVIFQGRSLDHSLIWELRQRTAYVSQDLDIGEGPVEEMLRLFFSFRSNRHLEWDEEELAAHLEFLELDRSLLTEDYTSLSGGEKQRVAILAALLLRRDIFLLDEATASLDGDLKRKVARFFLTHPRWTVLAISHDGAWRTEGQARRIILGAH